MKLHELREESIGDAVKRWTPTRLSRPDMIEWCKQNASKYLAQGCPIYRGMATSRMADGIPSNDGILDTTKLKRDSANSNGFYNWWIDSTWTEFPKRSESIICTTAKTTAEMYEDVHLIIPSDSCRIGVCPTEDIWNSFSTIMSEYSDASQFSSDIGSAISSITKDYPHNYEELKKLSKQVTLDNMKETNFKKLITLMDANKLDTLFDLFSWALDTEKHKFRAVTASNFSEFGDQEVWVSGKVLQVHASHLYGGLEEYLAQFFH